VRPIVEVEEYARDAPVEDRLRPPMRGEASPAPKAEPGPVEPDLLAIRFVDMSSRNMTRVRFDNIVFAKYGPLAILNEDAYTCM
jgi:hypothetical protein